MDSLLTAAARSLAAGDVFGALNRVALREDAPALALRGIVMARMGDLPRAKELLRRAAGSFGPREAVARARCVVAEAEIALAMRELSSPPGVLEASRAVLRRHGDESNAAHAQLLAVRRLLLLGQLSDAESKIASIDPTLLPRPCRAVYQLVIAGIAMRRLRIADARRALRRALSAAKSAGVPALEVEVAGALRELQAPAARFFANGEERLLRLDQVEFLLDSKALIVDACRFVVRDRSRVVSLIGRPVLVALARALGEAWPRDAARDTLIARAFRLRLADESHRARLRVEIGRLRRALRPIASITATRRGFELRPRQAPEVVVLAPAVEGEHAALQALLADGESWSSSALALALQVSQRQIQRALDALATAGKVQALGSGRARRWLMPLPAGITSTLLLPGSLVG